MIWHIFIQKDGLIADNFDAVKTAAALLEESHLINVYFPFCLKGIYYKCSCFPMKLMLKRSFVLQSKMGFAL